MSVQMCHCVKNNWCDIISAIIICFLEYSQWSALKLILPQYFRLHTSSLGRETVWNQTITQVLERLRCTERDRVRLTGDERTNTLQEQRTDLDMDGIITELTIEKTGRKWIQIARHIIFPTPVQVTTTILQNFILWSITNKTRVSPCCT